MLEVDQCNGTTKNIEEDKEDWGAGVAGCNFK